MGLCKATCKGPFRIEECHHNGGFGLVRDDNPTAPEPPTGVFKAHHLIPINKDEHLEADKYKVDFVQNHCPHRGKGPLFLVCWKGYSPSHNMWEPKAHFMTGSLIDTYQESLIPEDAQELTTARHHTTSKICPHGSK
ncbi:hypothetical protein H4R20_002579 [Coemansia guatemalensis]|uniref:Chromo domain-containing protein n=1 Tax=Coemansia guatemalensis TaxID=2761395 RepID=A0A9W8HV81_9FUNG|nr:hypothetical protein H4R20_002579 [Coemansia guatemalensis]